MIKKCPVIALRIVCKLNDHKYQFYRKKTSFSKMFFKNRKYFKINS